MSIRQLILVLSLAAITAGFGGDYWLGNQSRLADDQLMAAWQAGANASDAVVVPVDRTLFEARAEARTLHDAWRPWAMASVLFGLIGLAAVSAYGGVNSRASLLDARLPSAGEIGANLLASALAPNRQRNPSAPKDGLSNPSVAAPPQIPQPAPRAAVTTYETPAASQIDTRTTPEAGPDPRPEPKGLDRPSPWAEANRAQPAWAEPDPETADGSAQEADTQRAPSVIAVTGGGTSIAPAKSRPGYLQRDVWPVMPDNIPLVALIDETIAMVAPMARRCRLELASLVNPALPATIFTDPHALQQVLSHLLGNALKFTHEGGVVLAVDGNNGSRTQTSALARNHGMIRFTVLDTGIGIAPEDQQLVFGDQTQVNPHRLGLEVLFDPTQQHRGNGLAISRRLVTAMGGQISLTSRRGTGTQVFFDIPASTGAQTIARFRELAGRDILIVDASHVRGPVIADQLRNMGASVYLAENEMAAFEHVYQSEKDAPAFDLAIIAADRLGGRAFALAEGLRHAEHPPQRIAIALAEDDPASALALDSADHSLELPFRLETLLAVARQRVFEPVAAIEETEILQH